MTAGKDAGMASDGPFRPMAADDCGAIRGPLARGLEGDRAIPVAAAGSRSAAPPSTGTAPYVRELVMRSAG